MTNAAEKLIKDFEKLETAFSGVPIVPDEIYLDAYMEALTGIFRIKDLIEKLK